MKYGCAVIKIMKKLVRRSKLSPAQYIKEDVIAGLRQMSISEEMAEELMNLPGDMIQVEIRFRSEESLLTFSSVIGYLKNR